MMSSGKARPENAELERRVKRRPHRLQRHRWPPSSVVPSFVTITDLQRGHAINTPSLLLGYPAHPAAREPCAEHPRHRLLDHTVFDRADTYRAAFPLGFGTYTRRITGAW